MNFQTYYERRNTRSVKWDMLRTVFQTDDVLPMWVADMDFQAPAEVQEALLDRVKHGIYGYTVIDQQVKTAIVNWLTKRHQWSIQSGWLLFSPGVVPSLYTAIRAFTDVNDKIMIQTPVYTPFYEMINNQQRQLVTNPLKFTNKRYEIDFAHFEQQLKNGVKVFILCSPHNPVGRVWRKDELTEIARLCIKYNVLILSDEIHSDLIYPGYRHIPIASLSEEIAEHTITFMSPTKTFNLAGLQASYMIISNKHLRYQMKKQLKNQGFTTLNTMGITALESAYIHGEKWLHELIDVLTDHKNYVSKMFTQHQTGLEVIEPEGTYLLWIDCQSLNMDAKTLHRFMIDEAKVGLSPGIDYGEEGKQFMRMNIACPKETLQLGIDRIIKATHRKKIIPKD